MICHPNVRASTKVTLAKWKKTHMHVHGDIGKQTNTKTTHKLIYVKKPGCLSEIWDHTPPSLT
ncbi:hypothetical protein GCM10010129_84440 [Streptomyces fumigatiscleroticus]|nr:hypothetical protein GCM10010129_84440 [Streptomyces fumigatiscleroticus]